MVSPAGLVLECRPLRKAASTCASTSFHLSDDPPCLMHRPEEYLNALEEERRKIDAFRRELPICMQLLHDAIESYKEKLAMVDKPSMQRSCHMQSSSNFNDGDLDARSPNGRCVVEECRLSGNHTGFPFMCKDGSGLPPSTMFKPEWMCSSFLAEANSHSQERCQTDLMAAFQRTQEQAFSTSSKPFFHSKNKSGGAFTPFCRVKQVIHPTARSGSIDPMDLALTTHHKAQDDSSLPSSITPGKVKPANNVQELKDIAMNMTSEGLNGSNDGPSIRKARRCWSPELHRRFINALQQLGGSQVATPKQIRELMQVEGLTNDEVKSHLQKYRLHTRRPSSSQTGPSPPSPQVVVVGGIWVQQPEYTVNNTAAQQAPSVYNPPRQPPHPCLTASSQENCSEVSSLKCLHLAPSPFSDQKPAMAHSQSSLQGNRNHSALTFHHTVDPCREESVGDDVGSDTSSCRGGPPGYGVRKVMEVEDDRSQGDSINGFRPQCLSEDEDSRGSDTNLKMVCTYARASSDTAQTPVTVYLTEAEA